MDTIEHDVAICAYAAGLFDGEGSVSILCINATGPAWKNRPVRQYHTLMVSLGNTDPRPLVWLRDHFGGSVCTRGKQRLNHKQAFGWALHTAAAEKFLRAVRPYLLIKGEQADIAFALRATKRQRAGMVHGRGGVAKDAMTPELFAERESLREQMHVLNKRGA